MEVMQIIGIGMIAAVLSLTLRQSRPEFAFAPPILGAVGIFLFVLPHLRGVLTMFTDMAESIGMESRYLKLIIKMIGIAYLCQFAAELCRDVGESAIGGKIEIGGKLLILSLSVPIVSQLMQMIRMMIHG